jgi:acyl-CoA thioester hydrolase
MSAFTIIRRVEFGDTDMAGIMHFSNFFRFMEVAETAFLRARGLSVAWSDNGERYGFPRVSASCDFLKPLRFEDEVTIRVSIVKLGKKSLSYRFEFTRDSQPVAEGAVTSVFCRKHGNNEIESLMIPDAIRTKLEG